MQGITRTTHVTMHKKRTIEDFKFLIVLHCSRKLSDYGDVVVIYSDLYDTFMIISLLELYSLDLVMYFCVRCLSNVFSTNKSDRHDIAEILLKVALIPKKF